MALALVDKLSQQETLFKNLLFASIPCYIASVKLFSNLSHTLLLYSTNIILSLVVCKIQIFCFSKAVST